MARNDKKELEKGNINITNDFNINEDVNNNKKILVENKNIYSEKFYLKKIEDLLYQNYEEFILIFRKIEILRNRPKFQNHNKKIILKPNC